MMWNIHHFAETDSTNRLAVAGWPGDVFTAEHQTAGRGRLDHKWLSRPGENLMMSAVVGVAGIEPAEVATFPLAVGLAVAEALSQLVANVRLKWPNDIVVVGYGQESRKLSGILCERHGDCVVAGIGVNVRQTDFPPEISQRATSLRLLGCDASVLGIRDTILDALSLVLDCWRRDGFVALLHRIDSGIASDGSLIVSGERIYAGEAHVMAASL